MIYLLHWTLKDQQHQMENILHTYKHLLLGNTKYIEWINNYN